MHENMGKVIASFSYAITTNRTLNVGINFKNKSLGFRICIKQ